MTAQVQITEKTEDPVVLTKIEVLSGPDKTEYSKGEAFDPEGLVILASYSDGSTSEVEGKDCEISGYDPDKIGEQTVEVSYGGMTAMVTVTVKAEPTEEPTTTPEPTEEPTTTPEPTEEPTTTPEPTEEPTTTPEPTEEPTTTPEPTEEPTGEPTQEPTGEPTQEPSGEPTQTPGDDQKPSVTGKPSGTPGQGGGSSAQTGDESMAGGLRGSSGSCLRRHGNPSEKEKNREIKDFKTDGGTREKAGEAIGFLAKKFDRKSSFSAALTVSFLVKEGSYLPLPCRFFTAVESMSLIRFSWLTSEAPGS